MEVQFEAKLLPPGKDTEAVIEFRPRDMVKYCEHVVFEINGLSRKIITVNGEGAPLRVGPPPPPPSPIVLPCDHALLS